MGCKLIERIVPINPFVYIDNTCFGVIHCLISSFLLSSNKMCDGKKNEKNNIVINLYVCDQFTK